MAASVAGKNQVLASGKWPAVPRSWNEGLELARAAAIFLVLWAHGMALVPEPWRAVLNPEFLRPGWWGVRIFFAISGYLIARQILQVIERGRWRGVEAFFVRRWLRTVPTYWMVLVLVVLVVPGVWGWRMLLANALFLQSLVRLQPAVLEVGWSLVIEEWSYLVMGLLAAGGVTAWKLGLLTRRRLLALGWALLAGVLLLATAARWSYVSAGAARWAELKKLAALQFDSLAYGAGLALLAAAAPLPFAWLCRQPRLLLSLSLLAMALFSLGLHDGPAVGLVDATEGWRVLALLGYPLAGVLSCGLLLGLWTFEFAWIGPWLAEPIRLLARVSYSVYLLHLAVKDWLVGWWGPGLLPFTAYLLLSIVVGWLGWWLLERPFIALRARWR